MTNPVRTKFVDAIARECQTPRKRALLRRASGDTLAESQNDVFWLFYLLSPDGEQDPMRENRLFLIATLLAHDKKAIQRYGETKALPEAPKNLGTTLDLVERAAYPSHWEARNALLPDPHRPISPIERRLRLLLDARLQPDGRGEMPFRLRQTVHLILDKGRAVKGVEGLIDWDALLEDLRWWDDPDKKRQKNWAREFYRYHAPEEAAAQNGDDGGADAEDLIDLDEE